MQWVELRFTDGGKPMELLKSTRSRRATPVRWTSDASVPSERSSGSCIPKQSLGTSGS